MARAGPHQELAAGIHRRHRPGADEGERRVSLRLRPRLGHEQHRRRAVGQGRGVARGHRPVLAVEHREAARRAPRATCRCGAGCPTSRSPRSAGARPPGTSRRAGGRPRWRRTRFWWLNAGDGVLLLAGDAVLLGHLLRRLAHREAGRRLRDGGRVGSEVLEAYSREGLELRPEAPGPRRLHQGLRHLLRRAGWARRRGSPPRPRCRTSRCPVRMAEATSAIASLAEAQARFTVWAGMSSGRPVPSTTSRARLGAFTDGITWPMTTVPIERGVHLGPLDQLAHAGLAQVHRREVAVDRSRLGKRRSAAGHDGDASVVHCFGSG